MPAIHYEPLGQIIQHARRKKKQKQTVLEQLLGLKGGTISHWENGRRFRDVGKIRRLCNVLDINFCQFLTAWITCEPNAARRQGLRLLLHDIDGSVKRDLHGLRVRTVILGDRRNDPPEHVSDFALPVSISDLFFLDQLRCPMHLWFDKLVVASQDDMVPVEFRTNDVLSVGSPAVNHGTRKANEQSAFPFNISPIFPQTQRMLAARGEKYGASAYQGQRARTSIAKLIEGNRGQGFIDPFEPGVSHATRPTKEKGVLTFAPNPWNANKLMIIAAGQVGTSTAAALRLLARDDCFSQHPLGGVFQVNDVRHLPQNIQYENLNPCWVTRPYTVDDYCQAVETHELCDPGALSGLIEQVRKRVVPNLPDSAEAAPEQYGT